MLDGRLGSVSGLVDVEQGIISREIFVSDEIYRQEQERIFARAWLLIGHDSQIPKPGDFFASSMGEESVILCRDAAGQIHVFLNSCRHRGMKVCRYDQGNTVEFQCPYHGWSYATDGALVGVPHARDAYGPRLDRSRWGLVEVPRIANYKGTIWATWDPDAPPFADYLGGYKIYLDLLLDAWDGREGGAEVIGGVHKWLVPCNWKFPAERFSGRPTRRSPRPIRTRPWSPTTSDSARRSASAAGAPGGACSADPAPCSPTPHRSLASRVPSRRGTRAGPIRPRCGAGTSSTPTRRPRSRTSSATTTSATRGRRVSPSRTTWRTGTTRTTRVGEPSPDSTRTTTRWGSAGPPRASRTMGSGCRVGSAW